MKTAVVPERLSDPESFRSLLNSFLPRKRAIAQMLVRDTQGRVLLCRLTYKLDWDLPGGVVEVGESPRTAVAREVEEELGLAIEPGEPSKRLSVVEHLLTSLIEAGADRDALIVAHGGGVVSDIAGFVAATLFRGVRWVAVPTTLLAMVDASIGGKTGVDLGDAKNAVGAFHQPSAVFIDPAHVTTETERAFESGLAEVVKSACVGDVPLFDLLEREADRVRDPSVVAELVSRSAALKIRIISRDEREAGDRAFLNFGHTLGHALEAQGGYARLTHGEAVALGMVAALRVGRELGLTEPSTVDRVTHLLARLGLPTDLAAQPVEDALRLLGRDKKRSGSTLRAIFLRRLGEPLVYPIDVGDLRARYLRAASLP